MTFPNLCGKIVLHTTKTERAKKMSEIVTIKNSFLTVEINSMGAELHSVKNAEGKDLLWNGDPAVWAGRAPILFPVCGGLKDDKYIHNGKEYHLPKHGFAKLYEYEIKEASNDHAVFCLASNEELKKMYPFDFKFVVSFTLCRNSVIIEYRTENLSSEKMYFSFGSHEAYATPEGIEEYSVIFDKPLTLYNHLVDGKYSAINSTLLIENENEIPLKRDFFIHDALIFLDIDFKAATLLHRASGRKIRVDFDGFKNFLVWTKPDAKYICFEPWCGTPDGETCDGILAHKDSISECESGKYFSRRHTITFN